MFKIKLNLLVKILIAIILGILLAGVMPMWAARAFATFKSIFSQFLGFIIPLIILSMVASSIGGLGRNAGRMLLLTVGVAYASTIFSGYFTYGICDAILPSLLSGETMAQAPESSEVFAPYFTLSIPPAMEVITALVLAFVVGIGLIYTQNNTLKCAIDDFADIISRVIASVIIPCLPVYIFAIFLEMAASDYISVVMGLFTKVIMVIIVMHVVILLLIFSIAGAITRRNPLSILKTMLPAYMTALGTSSSAATIPVTQQQIIKNGVSPSVAGMVAPLCATIHMPGSVMKVVSCSMAIIILTGGTYDITLYSAFIFMLAFTAIAAPGVPGGMIMASLGVLQSVLGFDQTACGLMIAIYVALDSFGTACNVTGDGAIALVVDKFSHKNAVVNQD